MLGGIQPGALARLFGRAEREAGLLGRRLLVHPPEVPGKWTDAELPPEAIDTWRELRRRVLALEPGRDENDAPVPRKPTLANDAREVFKRWHDRHAERIADADDGLSAALSKQKGACIRFSLVMQGPRSPTRAAARRSSGRT